MITREQLESRNYPIQLHCTSVYPCRREEGPRGGVTEHVVRVRQSGALKTWKRDPERFRMPVKHGLRSSWYVDQDNAGAFHFPEDCPAGITS